MLWFLIIHYQKSYTLSLTVLFQFTKRISTNIRFCNILFARRRLLNNINLTNSIMDVYLNAIVVRAVWHKRVENFDIRRI